MQVHSILFAQWQTCVPCQVVHDYTFLGHLLSGGVPDQVPLARATRLIWYCWQDNSVSGKNEPTCITLGCSVESQDWSHLLLLGCRKPCHYVVPPIWRSLTSPPCSFHVSEFSFGCLTLFPHIQLFPEFIVVVNREKLNPMTHAQHIIHCIAHMGKVQ